MYSEGMPLAARAPTTAPAEVPTMRSASEARQPVSASSASSAPMSQEAPTTPPAPRTRPTRIASTVPLSTDCQAVPLGAGRGEKRPPEQEEPLAFAPAWEPLGPPD